MTRINCVPPSELCREHLVAEYRELPRVLPLAGRWASLGDTPAHPSIPHQYVLGKGHMLFFLPRLGWLASRHKALVSEMMLRGYRPEFTQCLRMQHSHIPQEWWGDWDPPPEALALNRARIAERLPRRLRS